MRFVNDRNPGEFRTVRGVGGSKVMLAHALVGGNMAKRGLIYEHCRKLTRYN